ncbi:4-hydroxy-3-methylbut-2-enyl diphosphate reductase [Planctomycetales bacterium]|nr:4-hydroxy-3-methylbut-2-enyl diphosphate reductase [Planctomycetales bacterium]
MHIILTNPRGFCSGVKKAIQDLNNALDQFGDPIYVYHEIVHNTWIVRHFQSRGVRFVNSLDEVPNRAKLMFSAHGVAPCIRKQTEDRNIQTFDATCPLVDRIHQSAIQYAKQGYRILLLGHRGHDEIVGIQGEAPEKITVVESEDEIRQLRCTENDKLAYLTQTTLSMRETHQRIELLRQLFPQIEGPDNSNICFATQSRQDAVRKLVVKADIVLVVGSRTSSNSRRLADVAESLGVCSYLVDGPEDIAHGWFAGNETIVLTAGASAPESLVQDCVAVLKQRFNATSEESK